MKLSEILPTKQQYGYWKIPKSAVRDVTVNDVAIQWRKFGHKLYDVNWNDGKYHILAKTSELNKIKEYNRNETTHYTEEDWDELRAGIKKNGIEIPVHVTVYRKGDTLAKLTEGNHRLVIAKELNIKEIPVVFFFYQGS